ncbi:MAG TPA: phosphate ABC transporter substrate-binding protein PstS [Mycobacteriales bacterium]|nr:phosphate ABC transporter substrate-binding protein PstS [Mycobacteriales bacterium]
MKLQRHGLVVGLVAGALALSACGSDNTDSSTAGSGSGTGTGSASGASLDCADGTLSWDGSSAQKTAVTQWVQQYQNQCSAASINYQGQGSGAGRTAFYSGQIPMAGSDAAIADEDRPKADARCKGGKAVNIPMVLTPVEFIYNVQGVKDLTVTPDILAKVFSGKITSWNDPEIAKANPGATLPSTSITTVHRSKDSGTTQNFQKFLTAQSADLWTYGTGQAWTAPGGQGAADSSGLVQSVKSTDGAIGYVDGPDATKNSLTPAKLDVGAGAVAPSADTVGKAISAAKVGGDNQDITLAINYGLTDAGTYPAILATYKITCSQGLPAEQAKFVKSFLTYTASDAGQAELTKLGYSQLPSALATKVRSAVDALSAA